MYANPHYLKLSLLIMQCSVSDESKKIMSTISIQAKVFYYKVTQ